MSLETIRADYLQKLEKAEALVDRARNLISRVIQEVPHELADVLDRLLPQLRRQLQRLRDNQFHIAVLGLEKAGKSTLVNAWLGIDILPAMAERCTYTATEIWSAASDQEQFYEIEYYTRDEFEEQLSLKRDALRSATGKDRDDLQKDVAEIEKLRPEIDRFLNSKSRVVKFLDVATVRNELKEAIATNKAQARAIRRLTLHTVALRQARDLVFHDVPGFDSPVKFHQEQAREKLVNCDTILYAKELDKPSVTGPELSMLTIADAEDPHVRVEGKVFVALTHIDDSKDTEQFEDWRSKAAANWPEVQRQQRLKPVCAPARLYRLGTGGPEVMRTGRRILENLERIGVDDGMKALKEAVQSYIDHDRIAMLVRRCDGLLGELLPAVRRLIEVLAQRYPDRPEELECSQEDRAEQQFTTWWVRQWDSIREDFTAFWGTKIDPVRNEEAGELHPTLSNLRQDYSSLVDHFGQELPTAAPEQIRKLYLELGRGDDGLIHSERAHPAIRTRLTGEAMRAAELLAGRLAVSLGQMVQEVVDWVTNRLWGIGGVREALQVEESPLQSRLEHGMSTLFLRFSRPAINLFFASPRENRGPMVHAYGRILAVLAEFYEGPDPSRKNLEGYLTTGRWIPLNEGADKAPSRRDEDPIERLHRSRPVQDDSPIVREITEDVSALVDYMRHSLYVAAGFEDYCHQELDRIRRRFTEVEDQGRGWYLAVRAAHRRGQPRVCEAAPNLAIDLEFRRGIVSDLLQLQMLLREVETSESVPQPMPAGR